VVRICLDQHATKIQLTKQLFEHGPLMVLACGVAGLGDRQTESSGVERHLGNECRATTGGGHDRAPQGLAVTHQLIEIRYTTWDLGNSSVANGSAESRDVNLADEVAEG
jgi:hypothetical protein